MLTEDAYRGMGPRGVGCADVEAFAFSARLGATQDVDKVSVGGKRRSHVRTDHGFGPLNCKYLRIGEKIQKSRPWAYC